jgi:hypothetical protein
MSTKGSEPRQLHRDHSKFRDNMEDVTEDTRKPTVKREVAKEDLPVGIRSRIYYGEVR